jgi:hypothetical protein
MRWTGPERLKFWRRFRGVKAFIGGNKGGAHQRPGRYKSQPLYEQRKKWEEKKC